MKRAWVITSYHLPPSLAPLVRALRELYTHDAVVVINDGDMERDAEYRRIAAALDAGYYNDGERLKVWPRGGEWWLRALRIMRDLDADLCIKLDDDVIVRRASKFDLSINVQAVSINGRDMPFIGPVVAFDRAAIDALVERGDWNSPRYRREMWRFPTDSVRHSDVALHWCDAIINSECARLDLSFRHLSCVALRSRARDADILIDDTWVCEVCRARGVVNYERVIAASNRR